jgi:hypothetical protein
MPLHTEADLANRVATVLADGGPVEEAAACVLAELNETHVIVPRDTIASIAGHMVDALDYVESRLRTLRLEVGWGNTFRLERIVDRFRYAREQLVEMVLRAPEE